MLCAGDQRRLRHTADEDAATQFVVRSAVCCDPEGKAGDTTRLYHLLRLKKCGESHLIPSRASQRIK
jgi:hypothetical protein